MQLKGPGLGPEVSSPGLLKVHFLGFREAGGKRHIMGWLTTLQLRDRKEKDVVPLPVLICPVLCCRTLFFFRQYTLDTLSLPQLLPDSPYFLTKRTQDICSLKTSKTLKNFNKDKNNNSKIKRPMERTRSPFCVSHLLLGMRPTSYCGR